MPDTHAATELKLYIVNDGELYRRQTLSILKNLVTKRARGEYKHDLAVKAFGYLTEAGAKKYLQEFGGPGQPWHKMFDAGTRKQAAEALARDFEAEAALGNYDLLLPKKYQEQRVSKKVSGVSHASKKLAWRTPEGIKVVWSPVRQVYFALWPGQGRIEDQQVLKAADADEMHGWLRDTYGGAYGLVNRGAKASRAHGSTGHARKKLVPSRRSRLGAIEARRQAITAARVPYSSAPTRSDIIEFRGFLRNASDRQVQGIYEKEKHAGRDVYAELAAAEAEHRGILDEQHATIRRGTSAPKSRAQLDHEISQALSSYPGRR
jgi:hypothetical protein